MPDALFADLPVVHRPSRARKVRSGIPAGQSLAQPWPLDGAINVVLFAGMGGACQGLEEAGFPIHVAVNHDAVAIAAHRALNPRTKHLQADIYEVCPLDATGGRPVNILWASPDCRDHSVAKGGAPRSPRVRSMPWQVCRWVGVLRRAGLGPSTVMLENVREIRGWGPLVAKRDRATGRVMKLDGSIAAKGERVPREQQQLVRDPRHIGRHWQAWLEHMRHLGVDWQDRDLICADFGVPTSRKRLFGVGQLDGLPIVWPHQTHAQRHSEAVKSGRLLPHASAASIIDWSLPLTSIFDRKKDLRPATQKRIAVGMKRFVLEAAEPFIIGVNNVSTRAARVFSKEDPLTTQCTVNGNALVGPALVPTTHTTSGDRIHDSLAGVPTLTAGVKGGELAAMAATVVGAGGRAAQTPPIDIAGALNTSTTKEDRCVVAAHLIQTAHGDGQPGHAQRWGSGATDLKQTMGTTTASGNSHGLVAAHLTRYHGERRPGEARGIDPADGLATQTTENRFGIVAAHLTKFNENSVGQHPDEAIDTLMAGAFLVHQRGTGTATSPDDAARTLATGGDKGGDHIGIGAAFLTEYYGTGGQHQGAPEALNTLPTVDRFSVTHADLTDPPLSPAQMARARKVAEFLRAHGVWAGGDIVTLIIDGMTWIVVDIGMRMLKPKEAAAAHELRMPITIFIDGKDRPLTKTEAMKLVGNSVPQRMAKLLASLNGRHPLDIRRPAVAAE